MQKTGILIGATGLTGSHVLEQLIENDDYATIKVFSRKTCGIQHPKVQEFLGDMLSMNAFEKDFTGDEVYCCIGTTKKKTPDKEMYRSIDVGIPAAAAQMAKKNDIQAFAVVSAIGANAKSSVGYNRIKGDMEAAVMEAELPFTYILRPSIIGGNRKERRPGEKIGLVVFGFLKYLIPKKYRVVQASAIARCMITLCQERGPSRVVESNDIFDYIK